MPLPNIHEIRIEGYKSLADETKLEIRPLTILAGANSSGKSSVMQPLLLLKQTLASASDPGVMELAGPNVQFTEYKQMFYRCPGDGKSAKTMKIGFSVGDPLAPEMMDITYRLSENQLHLDREDFVTNLKSGQQAKFALHPGRLTDKEAASIPETVFGVGRMTGGTARREMAYECRIQRAFLDVMMGHPDRKYMYMTLGAPATDRAIRQQLLNLIHIPGLRGNPERYYPLRKTKGPRFDGHFQDYVAGIVAGWRDGARGKMRLVRLSDALHDLGLTWKIEARSLDATSVEIVVGRLRDAKRGGAKDLVNIADVGLGVSQILPALVALMTASPSQLIHLEQPEIHLHPRAQRVFAKLLGDAAISKKRVIVETHSSILIRGIQTLVAKGELDPKLVKLHWFTRNEDTGATKVSSSDLDENGAFDSDWPEDFDDTYLDSEREYLDAVEARAEA